MADIELIALKPYKGRAEGERFATSLKNSRVLIAEGIAKKPAPARKTTSRRYQTRDMKAS